MKSFLIPLYTALALFCLQSCGGNMIKNKSGDSLPSFTVDSNANKQVIVAVPANANGNLTANNEKDLIGYWVGLFKPDTTKKIIYTGEKEAWDFSKKINISIDSIGGGKVAGHSVVAGNVRPFRGDIQKGNAAWHFDVKEPGDDKYDGKFTFAIAIGDSALSGVWTANNKIRIPHRKYRLTKKIFKYNPAAEMQHGRYVDWTKKKTKYIKDPELDYDGYDTSYFATSNDVYKYNASATLLTRNEVANIKKADIFILRNAIYARHGYSFKNQQLRAFFDKQSWYIPVSADVKNEFTEIEKKNIELLLRFEKNAKEYYDEFGRG